MSHTTQVLLAGFGIGLLFGVVGQRSKFCLLRGVRGWLLDGDGRKLRSFALALATAIIATQALAGTGLVSLRGALYLQPNLPWLLMLGGGWLFGYGMVLANGCGARSLVLLGSGNLRALVVLLCLGITAFMTLSGVLAPLRVSLSKWHQTLLPVLPVRSLDMLFASFSPALSHGLATALVATPLLVFALRDRHFRQTPGDWSAGLIIGGLVAAGWVTTGYLGADDFEPVSLVSLTFVAPVGDSIQYLMLSTGMSADFGVVSITGVLVGALLSSILSGQFQWQSFTSARHMRRGLAGGACMGIGGVLALGCSIGQGITGLSTLALASFLAAAGILAGIVSGLRGPLQPSAI